jgi:competence protein ComEA
MRTTRLHLPLLVAALALVVTDVRAGSVDVNTADAATLARELKGIGLKRAQAIVEYRTRNGPFKNADELALVKGLGRTAIERNRADLRFQQPPARASGQGAAPAVKPKTTAPTAR